MHFQKWYFVYTTTYTSNCSLFAVVTMAMQELAADQLSKRTSETGDHKAAGTSCCKFNSWRQPLNSRGAVIVLIWTFLTASVYFFISSGSGVLYQTHSYGHYLQFAILILVAFCYPLAGWLGDGRFGRYRVISIGLLLTWATVIASAVSILVNPYVAKYHTWNIVFNYIVASMLHVLLDVGYVWLFTNLLPLGIDQLQGSSSEQLQTYTYWYIWISTTSTFMAESLVVWLKEMSNVTVLVPTVCFTLAVVLSFLLNDNLVKEPPTPKLLKTILGVLKSVATNHRSGHRIRSAFTYWEDEVPSRIDRAKMKYGGPYTTEEVENVKSLFNIAVLAMLMGAVWYNTMPLRAVWNTQPLDHFKHSVHAVPLEPLEYIPTIILIPIVEILLSPVKARCLERFGILKRAVLGAALMLGGFFGIMALDVIGHEITSDAPCIAVASANSPKLNIDYRWLSLPWTLNGLGYFFLITSLFELIVAQAPYGMKSMLIGISSISIFLPRLPSIVLELIFKSVYSPDKATNPSCGLWLFLMQALILVTAFVLFCIRIKQFRKRERDDTVRDHTFVENFYAK